MSPLPPSSLSVPVHRGGGGGGGRGQAGGSGLDYGGGQSGSNYDSAICKVKIV